MVSLNSKASKKFRTFFSFCKSSNMKNKKIREIVPYCKMYGEKRTYRVDVLKGSEREKLNGV